MTTPTSPRRRLRFGLRSLLLLTTLVAMLLAWKVNQVHRQRQAVEAIEEAGGFVHYGFELGDYDRFPVGSTRQERLQTVLGGGFFAHVEFANLSAETPKGMRAVKKLRHLPYLRALVLTGANDDALRLLSENPRLNKLSIYGGAFSPKGLASLREASGLTQLTWHGPDLSEDHVDAICGICRLESLNFYSSQITDEGFARLLASHPSLTRLEISSRLLTDASLDGIAKSTTLQSVSIEGGDFSKERLDQVEWKFKARGAFFSSE